MAVHRLDGRVSEARGKRTAHDRLVPPLDETSDVLSLPEHENVGADAITWHPQRQGHPRHRTNPRAHIAPSPASVTRPRARTHVCSDGYAGTINTSCRHQTHPTCLIARRLQT
jgi:hypothetical protein